MNFTDHRLLHGGESRMALPPLQWRFRGGQADGSFYELWPGLQKCLTQFSPVRPDGGAGRRSCAESSNLLQREEREEVSARRRIWLCPMECIPDCSSAGGSGSCHSDTGPPCSRLLHCWYQAAGNRPERGYP